MPPLLSRHVAIFNLYAVTDKYAKMSGPLGKDLPLRESRPVALNPVTAKTTLQGESEPEKSAVKCYLPLTEFLFFN